MIVSKLLVSSFEDEGYGMLVRSGHDFLYRRDDPVGTTILLGDYKDMLYILREHIEHPREGGWLSESKYEARVASHVHISDEESDSLHSTNRRLSQSSDGA